MVEIIWEYTVIRHSTLVFEQHYGPHGSWAMLFTKTDGYLGTRLLKDRERPTRYVTIDRWRDMESFERFKQQGKAEYSKLDAQMGTLTRSEELVGVFEVCGAGEA
jgi:heme-degrading monooxygenase HmoA